MARSGRRWDRILKRSVGALFEPPPDPRQEFADVSQRQGTLLARIRQALAQMEQTKALLQGRADRAQVMVDRLLAEARAHLRAGRDDGARLTLQRRQALVREVEGVQRQIADVEQEAGRLAVVEQRLASRIEALLARREMIEARYNAAEAQVRIQEALAGVSDDLRGLGLDLERAEAQTGRLRARAAAIDRLVELGVLEGPGGRLEALADPWETETAEDAVERQLAALKQEIAAGGTDDGRR